MHHEKTGFATQAVAFVECEVQYLQQGSCPIIPACPALLTPWVIAHILQEAAVNLEQLAVCWVALKNPAIRKPNSALKQQTPESGCSWASGGPRACSCLGVCHPASPQLVVLHVYTHLCCPLTGGRTHLLYTAVACFSVFSIPSKHSCSSLKDTLSRSMLCQNWRWACNASLWARTQAR